ncbi:MAG: gamma-glutamyltransferase [Chloroflexi bacterium]|nr:gamma-glutamyltransferase [Chloroflexota bacterium]
MMMNPTPPVTYRSAVYSDSGVVAAPHYLASLSAAGVLRDGGSAVDAAIAANAVMAVTWPQMCGPGGDLFAQVWDAREGKLMGLNASGRAGSKMTAEAYRERGVRSIPQRGPFAVSVPGAVDGWVMLHERWGRLPLERLLRDAIRHAEDGFPVTDRLSAAISRQARILDEGGAGDVYLARGRAPEPGERLVLKDLASTFRRIAEHGRDALYGGELGRRIAERLQAQGSLLEEADIAAHTSQWVTPLSVEYRGTTVSQLPPNTQGITLLQMLTMLEPSDAAAWGYGAAELIHQVVERKKLAFQDRNQYLADPAMVDVPVQRLLDPAYARQQAERIGGVSGASPSVSGGVRGGAGDTIYLCTADRDGNMVSLIQSLFSDWGSGVYVPGTGLMLHNRAHGFTLEDGHANVLAPGKRPMHTLVPGFALRDGKPWLAFGTRGADGQTQTGVQILMSMLDFGLPVQAAIEAPRWVQGAPGNVFPPTALVLEAGFGADVAEDLRARGHETIETGPVDFTMGTVQAIQVDHARGCYVAGSDPRGDGIALPG